MRKRLIAFATGCRSDYGIARWVLQDIVDNPHLDLRLILTGSHLNGSHGNTVEEIRSDGFSVDREVLVDLSEDTPIGTARWMAASLEGLTMALVEFTPDVLIIVGDRFEALMAAQAANLAHVPIAHIHGGEITQGSLDDGMRHAITKLASVHFAATPEYGRRIIQLGEDPQMVHVVGAPGLCAVKRDAAVTDDELAGILGFFPTEPYALATYHPATAETTEHSLAGLSAMVVALASSPGLRVVVTGVNADPGNQQHREILGQFATAYPEQVTLVESLGHRLYLAALRRARLCIGNSSSGIIEAPALGVPTVNIGLRQHGRVRAESVIDVSSDAASVHGAIVRALTDDFALMAKKQVPPYGSGGASRRIVEILTGLDLTTMGPKTFRDCGLHCDSWSSLKKVTLRG